MNPILARRLRFYSLFFVGLGFVGWIILPPSVWSGGSRHNARRAMCQSQLKQIGRALQMYASDYDEKLPSADWAKVLIHYARTESLYQCPETTTTEGTTDYFFNRRFVGFSENKISNPQTLILIGDGADDASLSATIAQIPSEWSQEETSPARRHLDTANYLFADGHAKGLKAKRINRDFRMVIR